MSLWLTFEELVTLTGQDDGQPLSARFVRQFAAPGCILFLPTFRLSGAIINDLGEGLTADRENADE